MSATSFDAICLEASRGAAFLPSRKEAQLANRTRSAGRRPRSPPRPTARLRPDSAAVPSRPYAHRHEEAPHAPPARGSSSEPAPPRFPGAAGCQRARRGRGPCQRLRFRRVGIAGRPGRPVRPSGRRLPGAEPCQALLPAPRTCRAKGRASRRRPPKEGLGRPDGDPISPRAAPPANQRRAAAGRAAAGEGGGRRAVVSFCARLSRLAQPVRRSWRSAGRCRVCSRGSSAPPLRSFYGCEELRKKGGSSFEVEIRMQKLRTFICRARCI